MPFSKLHDHVGFKEIGLPKCIASRKTYKKMALQLSGCKNFVLGGSFALFDRVFVLLDDIFSFSRH